MSFLALLKLKSLVRRTGLESSSKSEIKKPDVDERSHVVSSEGVSLPSDCNSESIGEGSEVSKPSHRSTEIITGEDRVPGNGDGCLNHPVEEVVSADWNYCLELVDSNLEAVLADSTKKQYKYWFNKFEKFCVTHEKRCFPSDDMTVCALLSSLVR